MHEFSIARSLVETAGREASRHGMLRVRRLTCRIGVLRQASAELTREAFTIARRGTVCEGAELEIETTYMHVACSRCDRRYPVRDWNWQCPTCHADGCGVGGGDELELVSLEGDGE